MFLFFLATCSKLLDVAGTQHFPCFCLYQPWFLPLCSNSWWRAHSMLHQHIRYYHWLSVIRTPHKEWIWNYGKVFMSSECYRKPDYFALFAAHADWGACSNGEFECIYIRQAVLRKAVKFTVTAGSSIHVCCEKCEIIGLVSESEQKHSIRCKLVQSNAHGFKSKI